MEDNESRADLPAAAFIVCDSGPNAGHLRVLAEPLNCESAVIRGCGWTAEEKLAHLPVTEPWPHPDHLIPCTMRLYQSNGSFFGIEMLSNALDGEEQPIVALREDAREIENWWAAFHGRHEAKIDDARQYLKTITEQLFSVMRNDDELIQRLKEKISELERRE